MADSTSNYIILKSYRSSRPIKIEIELARTISNTFHNISKAAELDARLLLIHGSAPNALAGPINGIKTVAVNFPMISMVGYDSDQWAALLGHELAHLKLGHFEKNLMRKIPLMVLQEIVRNKTADPAVHLGTDLLARMVDTHFSRDQERESDYLGAIWAVEAGYSAFGAAELHRRLLHETGGGSLILPFLRSHPSSSERIETLNGLAERLTPSDVKSYIENRPSSSGLPKAELVKFGMYPETIAVLLGDPAYVEADAGDEFWHYCEDGLYADTILTLHFIEGQLADKRTHLEARSSYPQHKSCAQRIRKSGRDVTR